MLLQRYSVSLLKCPGNIIRCLSSKTTDLGIRVDVQDEQKFILRREFISNPDIVQKLQGNKEALKICSIEFGDDKDRFDLELYQLWEKLKSYESAGREKHSGRYCEKLKSVAVSHMKMKYLAMKMKVDPAVLKGPQIKYHPHMEIRLIDKMEKDKRYKEKVIYNRTKYVRMKKTELAKRLGNKYDSYYVYKNEIGNNLRLVHSRNNKFFRWVYYDINTGIPYELHGKTAGQKHRWDELCELRNNTLREIELSDILKYRHAINALDIPPIYIPTFRLPKPKWFRNNTISFLSESEVERLREKRKHGAISEEEEQEVLMPNQPTKFNETIRGLGLIDQNRQIDSDFRFGVPLKFTDPIPLAIGAREYSEEHSVPLAPGAKQSEDTDLIEQP